MRDKNIKVIEEELKIYTARVRERLPLMNHEYIIIETLAMHWKTLETLHGRRFARTIFNLLLRHYVKRRPSKEGY